MVVSDPVTIHIGMPKSASTFLQEHVWKQCESLVSCIPTDASGIDADLGSAKNMANLVTGVMRLEGNKYKSNINRFAEIVDAFTSRPGPKVISNEGLACANYSPYGWHSREIIGARLGELFPDAKILIIVRNQIEFLPSWFIQMKNTGHNFSKCQTLKEMCDYEMHLEQVGSSSLWGLCDYDELYDAFRKTFNADSLFVVPYEMLKEDGSRFLARINEIIGIGNTIVPPGSDDSSTRINARHTWLSIWLRTLGRKLPALAEMMPEKAKKQLIKTSGLTKKATPHLSKEHKQFLDKRYRENNMRLSELCNLNLSRFKYPGTY